MSDPRPEADESARHRAESHDRLEAIHGWEPASAPARKVLVAGAAGGFGSFVTRALPERFLVLGVDQVERSGGGAGSRGKLYVTPYDKRTCEDVFKLEKPDALVHVAFRDDPRASTHERYRTNVIGTMRLLEHAAKCAGLALPPARDDDGAPAARSHSRRSRELAVRRVRERLSRAHAPRVRPDARPRPRR
ncbi:NAD-dependent epimerase/dehydratase family protein [bacterium]|nr:NAD-dependent epimerase/dehydratase family protein [bacterium]